MENRVMYVGELYYSLIVQGMSQTRVVTVTSQNSRIW